MSKYVPLLHALASPVGWQLMMILITVGQLATTA
jgi:hypothetical protein